MKALLRSALASVALVIYRNRPLATWPYWLGQLLMIRIPANVAYKGVPSASGPPNMKIVLSLLDRTSSLPGAVAECGVFRGATLIPIAIHLRQHGIRKRVFGFDSFQGFDRDVETDLGMSGATDPEKRVGGFGETSPELVRRWMQVIGVQGNVSIVQGHFHETLRAVGDERFCFVHLDCDLYESYRLCLEFFYPRMDPGGIILVDEYNDLPWPGCNKAVDEFLADKTERLQLIELDNYRKYYLIKQ